MTKKADEMKWRTKGYPDDRELCFCEVFRYGKNVPFVLRFHATDGYWSAPGLGFEHDEVTRWCPIKEIMALLSENIEEGKE